MCTERRHSGFSVIGSDVVSGILWDNDGVLVDTERIFYEVNRDFLVHLGLTLTPADFVAWFLCDDRGAWPVLRQQGASETDIDEFRRIRDELLARRLAQDVSSLLTPGIDELLWRLHGRARMGIVTSSKRRHFDLVHRRVNISDHFEFVVTAESCERCKPSPQPYLLGLRHFGLTAAQCIAIEDSPRGLLAADRAGVRCIVLRNELTSSCAFDGAFAVVDSVEELGEMIDALKQAR